MKLVVRRLALLLILGINLPACHSGDGKLAAKTKGSSSKGELQMKTYYMGRFSIDVPVEMKQEVQAHTFRLIEIEGGGLERGSNVSSRCQQIWRLHLTKLHSLKKPEGVHNIVIKEKGMEGVGRWAKAILYYGDYTARDEGNWDVLVGYDDHFVWFKLNGLLGAQDEMLSWMMEVIRAYRPNDFSSSKHADAFYTEYGTIFLPFKRQENTYSRFQDSDLLRLEVDMNEVHEVAKHALAERLAAAIATRFAPGVTVKSIRSHGRKVAGLEGEEVVARMSASGEETQLQFCWEYRGDPESGARPEIQITMESADGDLNEKLQLWDAVLNSLKPMYQ